jgi:hypothetical protein
MQGGVSHAVLSFEHFQFHACVLVHAQLAVAVGSGDADVEVDGQGDRLGRERSGRGGLVFDYFAVLVGHAASFRPVLVVANHNSIPVLNIGHGTLLAIWFPSNGSNQLAVLPV